MLLDLVKDVAGLGALIANASKVRLILVRVILFLLGDLIGARDSVYKLLIG